MQRKFSTRLALLLALVFVFSGLVMGCSKAEDKPEEPENIEEVGEKVEEEDEAETLFNEGETFVPNIPTTPIQVGDATISITFLPLEKTIATDTFQLNSVGYHDGKLYAVISGKLMAFNMGDTLTVDESFGDHGVVVLSEDNNFNGLMSVSKEGFIVVSDFMDYTVYDSTDVNVGDGEAGNEFVLSKDNIGLTIDDEPDIVRIDENGKITTERWGEVIFDEGDVLDGLNCAYVEGDMVYVGGSSVDEETDESLYKAAVYGLDGNLVFSAGELEGEEEICYMHRFIPTSQGSIVMDGNCRNFLFYNKVGELMRKLDIGDITGLEYHWPSDLIPVGDGNWIYAVTQDRPDESGCEVLFLQMSGL